MSNNSTDSPGKHKYKDRKSKFVDAYIITILNDFYSTASARECIKSIKHTTTWANPILFNATTPDTIVSDIKLYLHEWQDGLLDSWGNPRYTWPVVPQQDGIDFSTGLYKRHYKAKDVRKVIAAAISHMRLWAACYYNDRPFIILEHDARFIRHMKSSYFLDQRDDKAPQLPHSGMWFNGVCSLNDPRGATRRAVYYHEQMVKMSGCRPVIPVNQPGEPPLPEGLPGNSAYIIAPEAAKQLLDKAAQIGIWPNDALMCRQLFPFIQSYYPYFTKVDQRKSTTTQ